MFDDEHATIEIEVTPSEDNDDAVQVSYHVESRNVKTAEFIEAMVDIKRRLDIAF